jgi:hypothetical protein
MQDTIPSPRSRSYRAGEVGARSPLGGGTSGGQRDDRLLLIRDHGVDQMLIDATFGKPTASTHGQWRKTVNADQAAPDRLPRDKWHEKCAGPTPTRTRATI